MYPRIGWILKLFRHKRIRHTGGQFPCFSHRTTHSLCTRSQDQLSSKSCQKLSSLNRHSIRHSYDKLIAFDSTDKGEANAGIAAGSLYNHRTLFYVSGIFSSLNHGHPDSILHAATGIEEFQLSNHLSIKPMSYLTQPDQRSVANQLRNISSYLAHFFHSGVTLLTTFQAPMVRQPAARRLSYYVKLRCRFSPPPHQ